jgi:hypothetical protein
MILGMPGILCGRFQSAAKDGVLCVLRRLLGAFLPVFGNDFGNAGHPLRQISTCGKGWVFVGLLDITAPFQMDF